MNWQSFWQRLQRLMLINQCKSVIEYASQLSQCRLEKGHHGCHVDQSSGVCWAYGPEFHRERSPFAQD